MFFNRKLKLFFWFLISFVDFDTNSLWASAAAKPENIQNSQKSEDADTFQIR